METTIKIILLGATLLLLMFSLFACKNEAAVMETEIGTTVEASIFSSLTSSGGKYQKLSVADAQTRMDSGDSIIIVDVRTPAEFAEGYIKDAINLPLDRIGRDAESVLPDKEAEILIYCRSGNRSKTAAQQLIKMGYNNVYDFGGIIDWTGEIVTE